MKTYCYGETIYSENGEDVIGHVYEAWIIPPKPLQYISLKFIATKSGISFDEIIGKYDMTDDEKQIEANEHHYAKRETA